MALFSFGPNWPRAPNETLRTTDAQVPMFPRSPLDGDKNGYSSYKYRCLLKMYCYVVFIICKSLWMKVFAR